MAPTEAMEQEHSTKAGGAQATALGHLDRVSIVCLMDTGDGAALVQRDARRASLVVLPVIGHWLKKAWGYYYRFTKYRWGHWLRWAVVEALSGGGARASGASR